MRRVLTTVHAVTYSESAGLLLNYRGPRFRRPFCRLLVSRVYSSRRTVRGILR